MQLKQSVLDLHLLRIRDKLYAGKLGDALCIYKNLEQSGKKVEEDVQTLRDYIEVNQGFFPGILKEVNFYAIAALCSWANDRYMSDSPYGLPGHIRYKHDPNVHTLFCLGVCLEMFSFLKNFSSKGILSHVWLSPLLLDEEIILCFQLLTQDIDKEAEYRAGEVVNVDFYRQYFRQPIIAAHDPEIGENYARFVAAHKSPLSQIQHLVYCLCHGVFTGFDRYTFFYSVYRSYQDFIALEPRPWRPFKTPLQLLQRAIRLWLRFGPDASNHPDAHVDLYTWMEVPKYVQTQIEKPL